MRNKRRKIYNDNSKSQNRSKYPILRPTPHKTTIYAISSCLSSPQLLTSKHHPLPSDAKDPEAKPSPEHALHLAAPQSAAQGSIYPSAPAGSAGG